MQKKAFDRIGWEYILLNPVKVWIWCKFDIMAQTPVFPHPWPLCGPTTKDLNISHRLDLLVLSPQSPLLCAVAVELLAISLQASALCSGIIRAVQEHNIAL